MSTTTTDSSRTAPTQFVKGTDETYAYRRIGGGIRRPLICLQHFTGTLDNWDPAVVDPLASDREVLLFDSAGVGGSTGHVPTTVAGMARHALDFLDAMCLVSCDVLGFSLGGMVAQQMAVERPSIVHRMILVGTAPRGGNDIMRLDKNRLWRGTSVIPPSRDMRSCKRSFLRRVHRARQRAVRLSSGSHIARKTSTSPRDLTSLAHRLRRFVSGRSQARLTSPIFRASGSRPLS